MHRPLILIAILLLGAALACGRQAPQPLDPDAAQATIEAAVAKISEAAENDGAIPAPTAAPISRTSTPIVPIPTDSPTPAAPASGTGRDFVTLENAAFLEQSDPQSADAIKNLRWVSDGVSESELDTAEQLTQLAAFHRPIFWRLVALPWMGDELTDLEVSVVRSVLIIAQRDAGTADAVLNGGWLADTVGDPEESVARNLALIAQSNPPGARQIAAMPFLGSLDSPSVAAVESLQQLAFLNPGAFQEVLTHPTLSGGITDDWAKIVATLSGVSRSNPGLIGTLLDPNRVTIESRRVDLPLSGPVELAIIRTTSGAARTMDLLETSVRNLETFMATPLPTGYVGVLYELAVAGSSAGTNFGTSIAIRPKFDVDDGGHEANSAGHIVAHEVAHYYWNNNADWVDEGAAELMASISELARAGRPLDAANYPCGFASSIATLETLDAAPESNPFACNYSLGERIFLDLYLALGDAAFRQGFRSLYQRSTVEDGVDSYEGTPVGIDDLRAAFGAGADEGIVDSTLARWYDGTVPHDTGRLDFGAVDPTLPGINGRIDRAFVSIIEQGSSVEQFSARAATGPVFLNLEYSFNPSELSQSVHLEIVESYEDGFVFRRRPATIVAQFGFRGGTQWLQVGPPLGGRWADGLHRAQVYEGSRKVADVQYVVTP